MLDDKNMLIALKDIVWAVNFLNGKFIVTPFILNNDHSEIMDLNSLKRYVVDDKAIKNTIVAIEKSKNKNLDVRAIENTYNMEVRTSASNYLLQTKAHAKPSVNTLKTWVFDKIVDMVELKTMVNIYQNYLSNKYSLNFAVKQSRNFGMKEDMSYEMPYTDFSTNFMYNDIYWAVIDDGKTVVPFVMIETDKSYEYEIKQLCNGKKKRIDMSFCDDINKNIESVITKMYKGSYESIYLLKGVDIEEKCNLILNPKDKDYEMKIKNLSKKTFDINAIKGFAQQYAQIIRDRKIYRQTTIEECL